ncbi:MAG: SEC-C domain-containing protein, partial [Clostridia bacterium]|nr:SEC-C domain-containing protein [Clostridia bacterium]
IRKNVLQYDDVMNKQRIIMYAERMKVIRGESVHDQIVKYIPDYVTAVVRGAVNADDMPEKWNEDDLNAALEQHLIPEGSNYITREKLEKWDYDVAIRKISEKTAKCYEEKVASIQNDLHLDFADMERRVLLRVVDSNWIDHIDAMDQLRKGIGLRAYGQVDPIISYKQEGFAMFDEMVERIQERTIRFLLKCVVRTEPRPVQRIYPTGPKPVQQQPAAPATDGQNEPAPVSVPQSEVETNVNLPKAVNVDSLQTSGDTKYNPATMKKDKKPGPNDPCPCGSGLKYKKCCGKP